MPGARRTAVFAAAFLLLSAAWATAESPQAHVLRAGTAVVFITDASLDVGRREGVVTVHLRDPLTFDGTVLAPAGTRAQLAISEIVGADGKRHPEISLERFTINAGLMPVRSTAPVVAPLPAGASIDATTLAEVDHIGNRYSIRIPFPFRLSGDRPASAYTPTPARTAPPRAVFRPDRGATPSPSPSVAASPSGTEAPPTKIPQR